MSERWFAKKPCQHCPFRQDVKPFLHPERAEELAYAAQNPYGAFHCHKTIDFDDDDGEGLVSRESLICAGFLALQLNENGGDPPEGFEPSDLVYGCADDMIVAYEEEWERVRA